MDRFAPIIVKLAASGAAPGTIICDHCGTEAASPPVGDPPGWDSIYRNGIGFIFTCPPCLNGIEGEWRSALAGGGGAPFAKPSAAGPGDLKMNADDRAWLGVLCANHERGLVFSRKARLGRGGHGARLKKLRNRGLVAFDSFVPSQSALSDWADEGAAEVLASVWRSTEPEAASPLLLESPAPVTAPVAPVKAAKPPAAGKPWLRKEEFLGHLAQTGSPTAAIKAMGLTGKAQAYAERKRDPEFARRWDEATRIDEIEERASGTGVAQSSDAKPELVVRPDSQSSPEAGGDLARSVGARDTGSKAKSAAPAPATTSVPPAQPAAAEGRRNGTWIENYRPENGEDIDWEAARGRQRMMRSNQTRLANAQGPVRSIKDQGAAAFFIQRAAEETSEQQRRLTDPVERARSILVRKGRRIYRRSVDGGPADRWFCSGIGPEATDAQIIAEAERVEHDAEASKRSGGAR